MEKFDHLSTYFSKDEASFAISRPRFGWQRALAVRLHYLPSCVTGPAMFRAVFIAPCLEQCLEQCLEPYSDAVYQTTEVYVARRADRAGTG